MSVEDVGEALRRIRAYVHLTPVVHSNTIDETVGCKVFFKCETLQRGGSFKVRGAFNQVLQLPKTAKVRLNGERAQTSFVTFDVILLGCHHT
jgi:threonine dehydratase